MKIWLLAENWPPRRGGIENYLEHIAQQLSLMGHTVTVIAPGLGWRFFWPLVRPKWLPLFIQLWRQAKNDRPDRIICGKGLFEGLVAYYLKRYLDIPYIVCTYGMEISTWARIPRTRRALARVLQEAEAVTYINEATLQQLAELGARPQQLVKLLPGVDKRFLAAVAPARAQAVAEHFGITGPYILTVGRLVARKGFDTLIEAFSQLDQTKHAKLKLVIVGAGPDRARLEQIVADNYMQTSVVWLPNIEDKHLPALYAGAKLFALTPRNIDGDIEGFGIVYLEAAALGIPAIGTTTGGVAGAVVSEETGTLVEPDTIATLTQALSRLLSDEAQRVRLGSAAAARVRREFQWEQRQAILDRLLGP